MAETELDKLAGEYRGLKNIHDGADVWVDVNSLVGRKFEIMKKLGEILGMPNTPASEVLRHLGEPDQLETKLGQPVSAVLMPGPIIGDQAKDNDTSEYFLVYYWRGKDDCLYFKIAAKEETVISHGWRQTTQP